MELGDCFVDFSFAALAVEFDAEVRTEWDLDPFVATVGAPHRLKFSGDIKHRKALSE